jgi:glycosyltransferase involved in cell wall biosynthesis
LRRRSLITVIETIGELKDHGVKLIIGGFGPLAGVIGESARNYPNVTYRSWVPFDQLFELESGFDLFVYVTDRDNEAHRWVSPTKLFTSMAFGRPIIVGEGTLSAKRIAAVWNGVAVPYGSKEELLKAIRMFKETLQ